MKMSTAEIKFLIKDCVKKPGMYTPSDFKDYITQKSDKDVTRNQITGAINQLVDSKDIIRVERGLYSNDTNYITKVKANITNSDTSNRLKKELYTALNEMENIFLNATGSISIWDLNNNPEIITKLQSLRESIDELKNLCK
ncbi:hypothetical protein [Fusicatenibacter sp.]